MKKSVSVALLVTFVVSACIPTFAQNVKPVKEARAAKTQFARVKAITDGAGVLVEWEMAVENRNVGYFVHRGIDIDGGLVTPSMVIGTSSRSSEPVARGGKYQVFDPQGTADTQYTIESVDLDGGRAFSYSERVAVVKDLAAETKLSSVEWARVADPANKIVTTDDMTLHPELRQLVTENLQLSDLTVHRWVVSQPGVKISVRKEGMYRVSAGELAAAGFSTEADSSGWRLFAEGVEQAISVAGGNAYIEFYGKPIDTPESDTRVYYLINDTTPGKRIETRVLRSIGGPALSANYPVTALRKERTSFQNGIRNGSAENYWGRLISSSPTTFVFNLTGVETSGTVNFTINLQGYNTQGAHRVRPILNGTEIPSVQWNGVTPVTRTLTLPASNLVEGNNSLEMTGMNPGDFSLFDSISIAHNRRYEAEQNKVSFFTPGYRKVDVSGFTSANVRVFDTTLDGNPKLIHNLPVVQSGANFKVTLPSSRNFVGYAVEDSALLVPASVAINNPSAYSASTQPYDLLIISYGSPGFLAASESWANYRRSQGFTAKVIDVADIFDEFGYGSSSADAIKAYLNYAYTNWNEDPKYVMLMGDAAHDPKNYEAFGNWDLVPSKNVELDEEETASDEALADFNDDGVAEFAIGRIPARDVATISTIYAKTVSFETLPNQSLDRGALFAYDLPNGWDFGGTSVLLANQLPPTMPVDFVDRQSPNAQTALMSEMNEGKFITNYAGHGSLSLWASSSFFSGSAVPALTNDTNPTFYTMLTCLNGYFIYTNPNFDSLAEQLLKATNGGASATWASTAKTTPDIQTTMAVRFYHQLAVGDLTRVGDLIEDAKTVIPTGSVRFSWVLLGDPMLKMR